MSQRYFLIHLIFVFVFCCGPTKKIPSSHRSEPQASINVEVDRPQQDAGIVDSGLSENDKTPSLPNIVIAVLDTVRFDFLSLANETLTTTPNLLRISQDGFNFTNAYSTHDNTPSSHFSIFTGMQNGRGRIHDVVENSLAYHLKQVGYSSLGISANLVVRPATMKSVKAFDRFISPVWHYFTNVENFKGGKRWFKAKYLEGMPDEVRQRVMTGLKTTLDRYNAPSSHFSASLIVSSADEVNAVVKAELPKLKKPGLLFLNYIDAHDPYYPPEGFYDVEKEPYLDVFYSDLRTRDLPGWMERPHSKIKNKKKRENFLKRLGSTLGGISWCLSDDLNEEQLERYRERYKAEIEYLDNRIGKLIDILKRNGFYENTVIFITSDHGESFGEMGYVTHWFKNRGDKESTRHVPFVLLPEMKVSGMGMMIDDEVSIADIVPTIYEVLGMNFGSFKEQQKANLGKSLLKRPIAAYFNERVSNYTVTPGAAITDEKKTEAPSPSTPKSEPSAMQKKSDKSPQSPVKTTKPPNRTKSKKARKQNEKSGTDKSQSTPKDNPDAEMIESLKALGYISD